MDGQVRLFAIFENYLANGSPGKSAAKPVVIYAKNYALFVSAGSHQSQRPSDKRCGSSHWGPGDVQVYAHFRTCAIQNRSAHRFVFRRLRRAGGGADGRIHAPRSSPKVPELLPAGARRESRSSAMFLCLILLHDSARYRTRALPWLPDGCTPSVTHESIDMTCAPMPARRLARAWTPPITWHVRRRAEF